MWISADFLERFQALGGVLPEEMYLDGDTADRDTSAVGIRVADEDEMYLQEYIQNGITELKRIPSGCGWMKRLRSRKEKP